MNERRNRFVLGIKRGALYGAAAGMLVGFLFQTFATVAPGREITLWRDFIVAGAVAGCLAGLVAATFARQTESPPGED